MDEKHTQGVCYNRGDVGMLPYVRQAACEDGACLHSVIATVMKLTEAGRSVAVTGLGRQWGSRAP